MDPYDNNSNNQDPWADAVADKEAASLNAGEGFASPIEPQPNVPTPAQPQAVETIGDLNCIQCGYNLRGLQRHGACPECGAPIEMSFRTDQLSHANPQWLKVLKQGMTWMIAGVIVSVVFTLGAMVFGVVEAATNVNQPPPQPAQNPFMQQQQQSIGLLLFGVISAMVYAGVFGVAYWLISQPEPGNDTRLASQSITRWTILPALGLGIVAAIIAVGNNSTTMAISSILQLVYAILMCVGVPASLIYLRTLAYRIPDNGLAKQTSIVLYGLIAVGAVLILTTIIFMITMFSMISSVGPGSSGPSGPTAMLMGVLGIGMCLELVAFLVFIIWWIVLICLYRGRFARAYDAAMNDNSRSGHGMAIAQQPY